MPQLDFYTYLFGEFSVGYSFILLYSLFFFILFKIWVLFFKNNDLKLNVYTTFNFIKNFYYNTILIFFRAILNSGNSSIKNKLNIVINIFFLKEYASLIIYLLTAFIISSLLFFIANYLNDKFLYKEKVSSYECGFEPFSDARAQVNIHFYIVGLIFVIFDVEVIYFLPWACNLGSLGVAGYLSILIFNFFLISGFIYEMNRGVFDWSSSEHILYNDEKLKIIAEAFPEKKNEEEALLYNNINYNDANNKLDKKNLSCVEVVFKKFYMTNNKEVLFTIILLSFFLILITIFIYFFFLSELLSITDSDFVYDFFFESKKKKIRSSSKRLTFMSLQHTVPGSKRKIRLYYVDWYYKIYIHRYICISSIYRAICKWFIIPIIKPIINLILSIFWFFFDLINDHDIKLRIFSILAMISLFGNRFCAFFFDEIMWDPWTGEEDHLFYEYFISWRNVIILLLQYAYNYPSIKFIYLYKLQFVLEFAPLVVNNS